MSSKNFGKVRIAKGLQGLLSTVGEYGFWYPGSDYPTEIVKECEIEHLTLWKNQNPYFAFAVEARNLVLESNHGPNDRICVWIREEDLLRSTIDRNA